MPFSVRLHQLVGFLLAAGALCLAGCTSFESHAPIYSPSSTFLLPELTSRPATVEVQSDSEGNQQARHTPQAMNLPSVPAATTAGKPLPISLPTALELTQASPLDIQIADERIRASAAQYDRARVLWMPNINSGVDYFRHDGQIQDIVGKVFHTSRSSLLLGAGPQAVVSLSDAYYAPLAARQQLTGADASAQTVRNDTALSVALAYFNVQQARGEVAGSVESLRRAEDLVARTTKLAPDLTPDVEINRAKTEAARRRQAVEVAYEKWQVASADLTRLLRLEAGTVVEPSEEPSLTVNLIDMNTPIEEMISLGLTYRPELAAQQALVQAALVRIRQEKNRPYLPVVGVRGVGSNTPGLAGGYFGGGINDDMQDFNARFSLNLQAVWEFQNLGFGNNALVREREADQRRALLELQRTQELIMAEIVQAHAQLSRATRRLKFAEEGVENAVATAEKNLEGLGQTKRLGEQLVLVFRPQEAVASVTALDQSYRDYYQAVADHNRAQFRLYRALGHPGQAITQPSQAVTVSPVPEKTNPVEPARPQSKVERFGASGLLGNSCN